MSFPTTSVLDDFNRADENPLSQSGVWITGETGNQLQVQSNQVRGTIADNISTRFRSDGPYGPDCEAYVTVATADSVTTNYIRLYVRKVDATDTSGDSYMMQWANDGSGCRIFKEVSGGFTALAQDAAARFTDGDQIGLEAVGSQLTVYKNGVSVLTVSDMTWTAAGYLGLAARGLNHLLDDFGGGTVVAAAGFTPRVIVI